MTSEWPGCSLPEKSVCHKKQTIAGRHDAALANRWGGSHGTHFGEQWPFSGLLKPLQAAEAYSLPVEGDIPGRKDKRVWVTQRTGAQRIHNPGKSGTISCETGGIMGASLHCTDMGTGPGSARGGDLEEGT